jgi:DNA-directed RNA polymerase subunit RPC12/RpoP
MGKVSSECWLDAVEAKCAGCNTIFYSAEFTGQPCEYYCPECGAKLELTGVKKYVISKDIFLQFRRFETRKAPISRIPISAAKTKAKSY